MRSLSEQLQQTRTQTEVCLYSGERQVEVWAGVMAMANLPLPPGSKYHHITAETLVIENSAGSNRKERLSTALNILEKYGCNLTNPNRPKFWRTVKHNNPVFRATVDAIQGGRGVLSLYGYSLQEPDGLSFPENILTPDVGRVAAVTLEVMSLRMEIEMIIKEAHPHPEFYERIIPTLRHKNCSICGIFRISVHCVTCLQGLCSECDKLYHSGAERAGHQRTKVTSTLPPGAKMRKHRSVSSLTMNHYLIISSSSWKCVLCSRTNSSHEVLCEECESPRRGLSSGHITSYTVPSTEMLNNNNVCVSEWQCKSCTVVNAASSVLCEVCERPRLATRPPVTLSHPPITPPRPPAPWVCQFCTYLNYSPATVCEMCDLPRPEPPPLNRRPPSPVRRVPALSIKSKDPSPESQETRRQRVLKEEGLKLIQLIREGEKKGISPEEVYTSLTLSQDPQPWRWMKSDLPRVLAQIQLLVSTAMVQDKNRSNAQHTVSDNYKQTTNRIIMSLQVQEVLTQAGGQLRGALALLQRSMLEPFHERIWSDDPEPPVDVHHPDKDRICRRLLAVYDLPSWGRCELALSLLLENSAPYALEDVVQAVRESHDREFIKRVLAKECPICLSVFPHSKVTKLASVYMH
uniref:RanBP2-type domain-containing protein n=1 Tax=Periophthalmus magnuspinnatus TaxID=409849 RepID=A0A3B4AG94_9GOBI